MRTISYMIVLFLGVAALAGMAAALNPLQGNDWDFDPDGDHLTNLDEYMAGSDPNNWDTDGDSLPDGWEVENSMDPADPSDAELDNDYFGGEEYASYSRVDPPYDNHAEYYREYGINPDTGEVLYQPTDPNNPDTDGDGIYDPDDAWPWDFQGKGSSGGGGQGKGTPGPGPVPNPSPNPTPGPNEPGPINPDDLDGDGILNVHEFLIGTDYLNADTDGDGLIDSWELVKGLDPNDWDTDNDMLIDGVEFGDSDSTDGHIEDSDNDGTSGGPGNPVPPQPNPGPPGPPPEDTDGDGLADEYEMSIGTDYMNRDTDGDGLLDPMELSLGTDPNDWDTDNDLLIDGVEMGEGYSTDGHLEDTDNDGIA